MDGLALCARFSIATNRLSYCGPADAEPALYEAIVSGHGSPRARDALSRFEALMPYLEAIGAANERDPFDREVVEAYWIGNGLLEAVDRPRFGALLTALTHRGLPPSIARRLQEHLPARPLAHHVFHVAFVGVGAVTGHVPTTLQNIEACRPALAEVVAVRGHSLEVEGPAAESAGTGLALGGRVRRTLPFDPKVLGQIDPGGRVAVHWSWPALLLGPREAPALESWTARSLAAANEALPTLGVRFAPGPGSEAGATSRT
jgi:Family of unknown function (DUF6390)